MCFITQNKLFVPADESWGEEGKLTVLFIMAVLKSLFWPNDQG